MFAQKCFLNVTRSTTRIHQYQAIVNQTEWCLACWQELSIARQLALAPMRVFPIGVAHVLTGDFQPLPSLQPFS
jgi:hypothetical protein